MTVNCESVCNQLIKGYADTRKIIMILKEVEYLSYLLTNEGVKPQPKKVEAMKRIKPSKNAK